MRKNRTYKKQNFVKNVKNIKFYVDKRKKVCYNKVVFRRKTKIKRALQRDTLDKFKEEVN